MKVLLTLSFVGTAYHGYQVQREQPTVQRALNLACKQLFGFDCDVVGCSRTDSGVHAKMFCAALSKQGETILPTALSPEKIPLALNAILPTDISVHSATLIPDTFHPRYDVVEKEYEYRFLLSPTRSCFEELRSWHIPRTLSEEALNNMQLAADQWVGKQDFTSYMAQGSKITDAVRTVHSVSLTRKGNVLSFHICADGFLYHMVRIMAGTLLDVGTGAIQWRDINTITAARDRKAAGQTAPPHGLYLTRVSYGEKLYLPTP